MTKQKIAKMAVKIIITAAISSLITKTLLATVPHSDRLKMAEMSGTLGGWYVAGKLEPRTDAIVDDLFARAAARKN